MPENDASILEGQDVILLGTVRWLMTRGSAEQTTLCLAKKNRVIFVEPFNSFPALLRVARWQNRKWEMSWGLRQVDENLWVYTPPSIALPGFSRWKLATQVNGWLLAQLLARVIRQLGFREPILWTHLYNSLYTLRALKPRLSIYECTDQDEALATSDRQRRLLREVESQLCKEADLVFGVTEQLVNGRKMFNPHTFEVNCAADIDYFGQALLESTKIPDQVARLPRPRLGYMGGVDPWKMDIVLLKFLARARPEWSIVLVGYVWFGFDPKVFQDVPNIHVLGPQPYEDLPGCLKGMDVCIMPFPLNDITRNGDAVKCYEYLAAGKPVVSTPVPVSLRLSQVVKVADSPEAFLAAIEDSLKKETVEARNLRLTVIKPHTWLNRTIEKSHFIRQRLNETASKMRSL